MIRDIKGYEGLYSVTNTGLILSHRKNIVLKCVKQNNGYLTVNLYKNKKSKVLSIHRLVGQSFIPNPNNLPQINHLDMDRHNNHIDNLEWCSAQENRQHAADNGSLCGEKNGNNKLTLKEVKEIRSKYRFRKYTHKMLSEEYGVGKVYIARIINRIVWKNA